MHETTSLGKTGRFSFCSRARSLITPNSGRTGFEGGECMHADGSPSKRTGTGWLGSMAYQARSVLRTEVWRAAHHLPIRRTSP